MHRLSSQARLVLPTAMVIVVSHTMCITDSLCLCHLQGRSDLTTLIQVVRFKFSQECPVYTIRKTPIIPKSGSFTHPRVMSTGNIYTPQTSDGLTYYLKKVGIEGKISCEHDLEIEKMKKEIDESRVEINMLKSSLEAAKTELSQEKAHVEELKESKVSDYRGSFTSSLIDAMQQELQQQITTEKQMKEKYKQRLDTMVTEMTQVGMQSPTPG